MADEPTAIRHLWWSKVHRPRRFFVFNEAACARVALPQTTSADRCKTCWPTLKDVTP